MVEFLDEFLPIVIYILLVVLLILLIMISYKVIKTMDKVKIIVDNVDDKVQSLNGIFATIDRFSNGFSVVGDRFIDFIVGIFTKLFSHKKSKKEEEEDNE
jgi:uncharacterized protein YoxC